MQAFFPNPFPSPSYSSSNFSSLQRRWRLPGNKNSGPAWTAPNMPHPVLICHSFPFGHLPLSPALAFSPRLFFWPSKSVLRTWPLPYLPLKSVVSSTSTTSREHFSLFFLFPAPPFPSMLRTPLLLSQSHKAWPIVPL